VNTSAGLSTSGRAYVGCVILAGGAAITQACVDLYRHPLDWHWLILAGLTLLSGSITVKVPSIPATISVSETFVFTAVMLFGPSAGTVTVALDGLIISLWLQRKKREAHKALFNVAAPSVSLWASAQLYFALSGSVPLAAVRDVSVPDLLVPLLAFTLAYFLLNSSLIAFAIAVETETSAIKVWRENFVWLSLNFFSGASVALLLVASTRSLTLTSVGIIIPLLIISYLTYKTSMGRLEDTTRHLSELNLLYLSTIETLAMWIDAKDQITHGHIRRVQTFAVELARELGVKDEKLIKAIEAAALLHDMGKLAVPEHILNKPGKLTPGEFEKMKMHASIGAQILSSIDFPYPVVPIVRHHHENWDGSGYPDGFAGTDIPIGARILAVVDCFDALTSDRPYRPRLQDEEAVKMLCLRRGTMYDPLVVDAFLRVRSHLGLLPDRSAEHEQLRHDEVSQQAQSLGAESRERRVDVDRGVTVDLHSDVGKSLLQTARQAVPVSLAVLFSHDAETDTLSVAHALGDGSEHVADLRLRVGHGVSGWVAATRRAMANADPVLDLGDGFCSDGERLQSCLCLPVVLGDLLLGVVTLFSNQPSRFSQHHKDLLESHVREFVGDLGRRSETLDRIEGGAEGQIVGEAVDWSFVYGHLYGQRVALVVVSLPEIEASEADASEEVRVVDRLVRDKVRASDLTLRTGQHEILLVLPHTDVATATATADRIATTIQSRALGPSRGKNVNCRVRYGVAISPDDGATLHGLLTSARSRLDSTNQTDATSPTVH
jgi:putative nucleotidyltransferase with HDIG domain